MTYSAHVDILQNVPAGGTAPSKARHRHFFTFNRKYIP